MVYAVLISSHKNFTILFFYRHLIIIFVSMKKDKPYIIDLPKIYDPRGSLSFAQDYNQIPFEIKRVYWTYDVPAGETRGAHSHRQSQEVVIAVSGSFVVNLFDGNETISFELNRPFKGLYVPPGYWRTLDNFSTGSVCLVLTSTIYSEDDYIRDYDEFIKQCNR